MYNLTQQLVYTHSNNSDKQFSAQFPTAMNHRIHTPFREPQILKSFYIQTNMYLCTVSTEHNHNKF